MNLPEPEKMYLKFFLLPQGTRDAIRLKREKHADWVDEQHLKAGFFFVWCLPLGPQLQTIHSPLIYFLQGLPNGEDHLSAGITQATMSSTKALTLRLVSRETATARQWGSSPNALSSLASTLTLWTTTPTLTIRLALHHQPEKGGLDHVLVKVIKSRQDRRSTEGWPQTTWFLKYLGQITGFCICNVPVTHVFCWNFVVF